MLSVSVSVQAMFYYIAKLLRGILDLLFILSNIISYLDPLVSITSRHTILMLDSIDSIRDIGWVEAKCTYRYMHSIQQKLSLKMTSAVKEPLQY